MVSRTLWNEEAVVPCISVEGLYPFTKKHVPPFQICWTVTALLAHGVKDSSCYKPSVFTTGQGQLARKSTGVLLIQETCKLAFLGRQERLRGAWFSHNRLSSSWGGEESCTKETKVTWKYEVIEVALPVTGIESKCHVGILAHTDN